MKTLHKIFFIKYKVSFFISKFILNNISKLFIFKFIRYSIDTNKYSFLSIFCTFLLLFGQLPLLKLYTKQVTDKLIRSSLIITQNFTNCLTYIYKLLNFFLLTSATDNCNVKTKNDLGCLRLIDNSYYAELLYFPRLIINSFNINIYINFSKYSFLSLLEKVTIFRLLQLPVNLGFVQQKIKRRRFVYKKVKSNKIK